MLVCQENNPVIASNVIPANAGIQKDIYIDSHFHGNDKVGILTMHSFLLITKTPKTARGWITTFCKEKNIAAIDQHNIIIEGSIGIKDIRTLQKDLFLTPVQSKTKAIIIQNGDTLTNEAQNALLKTLEEPPDNTIIIISAQNKNAFLPTVLSRCKIIELGNQNKESTENFSTFNFQLSTIPIGDRLAYAQNISKTKEEAISWTEQSIITLRDDLLSSHSSSGKNKLVKCLRELQRAHTTLSTTNVQPRFIIENLLLSI